MTTTASTHHSLAALLAGDLAFQAPVREAHLLHALHPFAARFPHGLASYFIQALTEPGDVVLDPMCGSGVTLLEGWLAGRSVIGVDLDPLARRQSAARTAALDSEAVRAAGDATLQRAADLCAGASHPARPLDYVRGLLDDATQDFLNYWFFPETQQELAALLLAIRAESDPTLRNLLEVVFSSTIVTKSGGVSRARDLAHTRPHRVADKQPRSALRQFEILLNRAVDAYASVNPNTVGESRIIAGDARALPVPDDSVNLIVTSPPYANALDYMRAHKFSLAWLGEPIPRLSELRGQYIGAERQAGPGAGDTLPTSVRSVIDELAEQDTPKSSVLFRYFGDMAAAIGEMARVLRPGAAAIIVVGPSTMRGILIPTHRCLADIAGAAGLDVIAVAPRSLDRDRRMMPARAGQPPAGAPTGIELRMHTEYVIGAVKP
ncbi:MAG: site-specific DNA-methyltransferase [Chloroflexi bacterium]|nr:site-specific DNA-methyltransferase [Chloroflexota bacterium]